MAPTTIALVLLHSMGCIVDVGNLGKSILDTMPPERWFLKRLFIYTK